MTVRSKIFHSKEKKERNKRTEMKEKGTKERTETIS